MELCLHPYIRRDIDLYENSHYSGFVTIETIEEYFEEYRQIAEEKAKTTPWDHIVLYSVFEYGKYDQSIISADFMALEMPFGVYTELVERRCDTSRFFFIRGRKEYYDE